MFEEAVHREPSSSVVGRRIKCSCVFVTRQQLSSRSVKVKGDTGRYSLLVCVCVCLEQIIQLKDNFSSGSIQVINRGVSTNFRV